jgi:lipopolysaccharide biosynthesis glycosyltransferase
MIPIFIGYDPREAIAFHVCANSIIRHASGPVQIIPLSLNLLGDYEEKHTDGSNHFIYSRFLVPHLMDYKGWAIFMDGDMIVRDDIYKLWDLREVDKDVMVVKHDYKTKMETKYLGAKNENYPRKNWSSVILWNCQNHPNKKLTPEYVQNATGAQLHRFQHLDDARIGELPAEWNWLPDEYGANPDAKLLHYTLGTPSFHEFADTPQGAEWHRERILTEYCEQHDLPLKESK